MKLRELVNVASYGTDYQLYVNNCYKGSYTSNKIPNEWLSYTVADIGALAYELQVSLKPDDIMWWK